MLPLTIPHRFDFGDDGQLVGDDLLRPEAWDALRIDSHGVFALPTTRQSVEGLVADHPEITDRANAIDEVMPPGRIASYGVGVAILETALHNLGRRVVVGEYAPLTVARLRQVLPDLDARRHDLLADAPLKARAHLLHRVDTEFTDEQWRRIMRRFAGRRVLVVASTVVGWRRWRAVRKQGERPGLTRAGWLRNRTSFERLWRPTHRAERLRVADLHGWMLTPR